jgi:hypothetical protein
MTICIECGESATRDHHVVPKSRGGGTTVPLCEACHALAHDIRLTTLIRDGRARSSKRKSTVDRKQTIDDPCGLRWSLVHPSRWPMGTWNDRMQRELPEDLP